MKCVSIARIPDMKQNLLFVLFLALLDGRYLHLVQFHNSVIPVLRQEIRDIVTLRVNQAQDS